MTALRVRLEEELLECEWSVLATHHAREASFMVDPQLDLLDAAVAVASDDRDAVAGWLASGLLARPTAEQAEAWAAEEEAAPGPRFVAVIVQPFVLVQRT